MNFSKQDIKAMDTRYRAHFVNSLSGYKSANLIGTRSSQGLTNACIVSSVVHLGADPALVAFVHRPHTVERHTLENILQTKAYTINHVGHHFYEAAHHTSARYPRDVSEFEMAQIDIEDTDFPAPYAANSRIRLGMRLVEALDLSINGTVFIIGEISELFIDDTISVADDGKIDLISAETVCVSGLDEYHGATRLARLPYAKPK